MERRKFIGLSIITSLALILPKKLSAAATEANSKFQNIDLNQDIYDNNKAQTLMIFLYGGASQLVGNLTNFNSTDKDSGINDLSRNSYVYFNTITPTQNNFWEEAGGDSLENLLAARDTNDHKILSVYRNCYSQERENKNNKAHFDCIRECQKGASSDISSGMVTNLAKILEANNLITENQSNSLPFVTINSPTIAFYEEESYGLLKNFEKPISLSSGNQGGFSNPFYRYQKYGSLIGIDPNSYDNLDETAQLKNSMRNEKMYNFFNRRVVLKDAIDSLNNISIPTLTFPYPELEHLQDQGMTGPIKNAVKFLIHNPDTKVVTMELGNWDDHNAAKTYVKRSKQLFDALRSAKEHLEAEEKLGSINIMVFSEFGRNVSLNSSKGWDHGNLQNFYVLGGTDYFNHQGIIGETTLVMEEPTRVYMKPKGRFGIPLEEGVDFFDPRSIAATFYKIYGINDPNGNILTQGHSVLGIGDEGNTPITDV